MRRLLVVAALLIAPVPIMAQQPATPSAPPLATKMASDEVMALLEKGEVFFLDVAAPVSSIRVVAGPSPPYAALADGAKTRFTATVRYQSKQVRDMVMGTGMARGAGLSYDRLEDLLGRLTC